LADVVARGPGRLESRPDLKEPVERIAVWQDQLIVRNAVSEEGRLQRKRIDLMGSRPSFVDAVQATSLDAGEQIVVWLKPKPPPKEVPPPASPPGGRADPFATADSNIRAGGGSTATAGLGGGGLEIERLLAYQDVHLVSPNRKMTGRKVLDAEFVQ